MALLLSIESIPFVVAGRYGLAICIAIMINRVLAGRGRSGRCCWKGFTVLLEGDDLLSML